MNQIASDLARRMRECGEPKIAEHLGITVVQACRKANGQASLTLDKWAQVFDLLKLRLVGPEQVVIGADELQSLRLLAHKQLGKEIEG